jgi:putative N6-adenine-specific DNA methylase
LKELLKSHFGDTTYEIKKEYGGVSLKAELITQVALLRLVRIPTGALLRIAEFKARDFPKIFNKAKKFPWNQYFYPEHIEVHCSSKKSRLIHTDRMARSFRDGIEKFWAGNPSKKKAIELAKKAKGHQHLYARLDNDICTLSIDLAGDNLHKRGYRLHHGGAPLRENLAFACLYALKEKSLLSSDDVLFDPFCGTGTLLFESRNINPKRSFAYEFLPIGQSLNLQLESHNHPLCESYQGRDLDPKVLALACENAKHLGLDEQKFKESDAFECDQSIPKGAVIVANPPYGKRIGIKQDPKKWFTGLCTKLHDHYAPKAIYLLLPDDLARGKEKIIGFSNGGIDVSLSVWK